MQKPELRYYGITLDDIIFVESYLNRTGKTENSVFMLSLVSMEVLAGLFGVYLAIRNHIDRLSVQIDFIIFRSIVGLFGMALVALSFSFFGALFISSIYRSYRQRKLEKQCPQNKQVLLYKESCFQYAEWLERTKIDFWLRLNGIEFENEVARLFRKQGFKATTTRSSGDAGVDIFLQKENKITIVQCKAHKKPVGPHTIRDLYGTLIAEKADEAILVSLSGFTSGVIKYVIDKPIRLMSLTELLELQNGLSKNRPSQGGLSG